MQKLVIQSKHSQQAVCLDLFAIVRSAESLPKDEIAHLAKLSPEQATPQVLLELDSIRRLLKSSESGLDPYALVSATHRPLFELLLNGSKPTTERVLDARRQIRAVANAWGKMRDEAIKDSLLEAGTNQPFLELLMASRRDEFDVGGGFDDPIVPAFSDREGRLLAGLDNWLNHEAARRAMPSAAYEKLYQNGRIEFPPRQLPAVLDRVKAALEIESKRASQGRVAKDLPAIRRSYAALGEFFGQLSVPPPPR